ncbi:MAG TPA: hypothetical protein DEP35_07160 [Deltaproteobacteria bacterium]|nr:hypothetical protein [Deltaproteobacteria bacterium]
MRQIYILVISLALFTAGIWPVVASAAQSAQIVDAHAHDSITIQSVMIESNVVSGDIVNHANHSVRDVTVLIQHAFAWKNEFRPGKKDPSRAEFYTVAGEIPAGGSKHFSMHLAEPLPVRTDGTFVTRAEIARYTQVGVATPRSGALSHCTAREGALAESGGVSQHCAGV